MKDYCGDRDNGKARAKTERSGVRLGKWTTKGPMLLVLEKLLASQK